MSHFRALSACALAAFMATLPASAHAQLFTFQDNSVGYRYGTQFKEPGVRDRANPNGSPISKNIVTLSHVDSWQYGSNFLNLDYLKSNGRDPANKTRDGAEELYFIYRDQLSPNKILGLNAFPAGPLRDVTFEAGFDRNTKSTAFGSQKWL